MNADVLIWGPIGSMYSLGKAGTPKLTQYKWRDLPDSELEDAINWVIEERGPVFNEMGKVKIHIYSETMYMPVGQVLQIGKNRAGGGTMFHYMIVSDEKIESKEQAEKLVWEALKGTVKCAQCQHEHEPKDVIDLHSDGTEMMCVWCVKGQYEDDPFGNYYASKEALSPDDTTVADSAT